MPQAMIENVTEACQEFKGENFYDLKEEYRYVTRIALKEVSERRPVSVSRVARQGE